MLDSLDSTFSFGNEMSWENPNALQSSNDGSSIRLAQADSGRSLLRELSGFDTGAGSAPEAVAPSGGDEWLTQFAYNLAATGEDYLSIRNKVGMKMGRPPSTTERDIIKGAIQDFMNQDAAERVKRTRSGRQLPVGGGGQVQVQPRRENSERFVVTQKSAMHEASVARGQGGGIRQPHKRVRSGNLSSSFRNLSIDEEDEAGMLAAAAPGSFRDLLGSLNTDLDSLGRAPPAAPQQAQPPRPKVPEDAGFDVVCVRVPKGVTGGNMVQFATKTGSRVAARVPAGLVTGDIFRVRIPKNPSSGGNGGAGPAAAGVMMSGGLSLPNGGQASGWTNPAAARNPAQQVSAAASRAPSKKPAQRRKARFWTPEEDAALRAAVVEFKERQWKKIAARVPGRTHQQCLQRWRKVLRPDASNNVRKGKWTEEEDRTLYKLVLDSVGGKREKLSGKVSALSVACTIQPLIPRLRTYRFPASLPLD